MTEFLGVEATTALFQVILIDLALAGDNAIVIGLAAAGLLQKHRWIGYAGLAVILYVAVEMVYRGTHEVLPVVMSLAARL